MNKNIKCIHDFDKPFVQTTWKHKTERVNGVTWLWYQCGVCGKIEDKRDIDKA